MMAPTEAMGCNPEISIICWWTCCNDGLKKKYDAATILKKSCLKHLVLGEILQILHVMVTVKKWITTHSSGWQPISITLDKRTEERVSALLVGFMRKKNQGVWVFELSLQYTVGSAFERRLFGFPFIYRSEVFALVQPSEQEGYKTATLGLVML
ncbi:hypothetical protein AAC387_Pa02g3230 [Persea americana]